jgi:membrane protein insertase Oxa1/YidC/SpoIIIJ
MLTYMPLFMGFLFLRLASGLVLYILTSNIVGTAQQWFLMRGTSAGGENGGNGKRSEKEKKRK